jgi:ubiquinone/menaquinone biosynthesis C-methylase UbiE
MRGPGRKSFLAMMFLESMRPYELPGEEWSADEMEFLPDFVKSISSNGLVLDLAGGYGRVTSLMVDKGKLVVLTDLSIHSLKLARSSLNRAVDLVQSDFLHLPFVHNVFERVWFTQAFEYVPADFREVLLRDLYRIVKKGSLVFVNVARVPGEASLFSYLRSFVYWRILKRKPVIWGDYIYKLKLEHYHGWHYHSVVFSRRIEKVFEKANFRILKGKSYHGGYLAYLLQA